LVAFKVHYEGKSFNASNCDFDLLKLFPREDNQLAVDLTTPYSLLTQRVIKVYFEGKSYNDTTCPLAPSPIGEPAF
jgi:hypothetical protein